MRTAVLADVHSNLEALKAVLEHIRLQRIKNIIIAGDLLGYGANPNEVLELLEINKADMIIGEHDSAVLSLQHMDFLSKYAQQAIIYTVRVLTKINKDFLHGLPEVHKTTIDEKEVTMVHGSPNNPKEYVYSTTPNARLLGMLNETKSDILLMGHTHQPFVRRIGNRLAINPGSVGQPRTNEPEANYCILDPEYMQATIQRVKYDVGKAAKKIIEAGLPRYLADRLFEGR